MSLFLRVITLWETGPIVPCHIVCSYPQDLALLRVSPTCATCALLFCPGCFVLQGSCLEKPSLPVVGNVWSTWGKCSIGWWDKLVVKKGKEPQWRFRGETGHLKTCTQVNWSEAVSVKRGWLMSKRMDHKSIRDLSTEGQWGRQTAFHHPVDLYLMESIRG